MKTQTKTYELQIDEKPRGAVIRLNDENGCVVRVCGVPLEMVYDEQGKVKDCIDITFPFENMKHQELLDCIHNLMGVFDTPVARMRLKNDFIDEARQIGRNILEKNGISTYNK